MKDTGFIFQPWQERTSHYALMKLDEDKICALEATWGSVRSHGVRAAMTVTFGGGWGSVLKKVGKQTLKHGGRKALGAGTLIMCGYFSSASVVLITKSVKIVKCAKTCHSLFSGGLDLMELCASTPIHIVEIGIFGRPVLLQEGQGFDLFSDGESDPLKDVEELFKK